MCRCVSCQNLSEPLSSPRKWRVLLVLTLFSFFLFFEIESHKSAWLPTIYVTQAGLKPTIFLPQPPDPAPGLQVCTITPGYLSCFLSNVIIQFSSSTIQQVLWVLFYFVFVVLGMNPGLSCTE
jgi:hypothetical protein